MTSENKIAIGLGIVSGLLFWGATKIKGMRNNPETDIPAELNKLTAQIRKSILDWILKNEERFQTDNLSDLRDVMEDLKEYADSLLSTKFQYESDYLSINDLDDIYYVEDTVVSASGSCYLTISPQYNILEKLMEEIGEEDLWELEKNDGAGMQFRIADHKDYGSTGEHRHSNRIQIQFDTKDDYWEDEEE